MQFAPSQICIFHLEENVSRVYVFWLEEDVSRAMGQSLNFRLAHDQVVYFETGSKFLCQSAWCQKAIEVGQRFSLEMTVIKKSDLSKRKIWTFCVFKLLIWCQKRQPENGSPAFDNSHFDCCRHSPGCALSNHTQHSHSHSRIRRRQNNLSTVLVLLLAATKRLLWCTIV